MFRTKLATACLISVGVAHPAFAQANPANQYAGEFERPYGFGYGEETQSYDAYSRDVYQNRVIIDGRMVIGEDLSNLSQSGVYRYDYRGAGTGFGNDRPYGGSTAVGNQLNVITNGSNNIVVIDSNQNNSGDQNIILNGELDLDD